MKATFWTISFLIFYTYAGYTLIVLLVSLFRSTVRRDRLLRHAAPAGARRRTLLAQSADLLGPEPPDLARSPPGAQGLEHLVPVALPDPREQLPDPVGPGNVQPGVRPGEPRGDLNKLRLWHRAGLANRSCGARLRDLILSRAAC